MTEGRALRVAVVHGYYSSRQPSGENVVVDLQVEALRRAGHEVHVVARRQDDVELETGYVVRAAWHAATGLGPSPVEELRSIAPDVVHVHNLFPNFGRRWVEQVQDRLVATLHNYRPICPAATLFRDGQACTLCPQSHRARHAVRHGCYKGDRLQSLPVAAGTRFEQDPVLARARRVVTLNDTMRATYADVGVPAHRLVTVANFVPAPEAPGDHEGDHWLFVGRLTRDKGVLELLSRWPRGRRLRIVGDGPLRDDVVRAAATNPHVEFVGPLPAEAVRSEMARARGLVFPSLWPEGLPTVYLEALSTGLPVLAWPQSVVADLVAAQGTGVVHGGDLAGELDRVEQQHASFVTAASRTYAAHYSESAWVASMEAVYRQVADGHGTGPARPRGPDAPA